MELWQQLGHESFGAWRRATEKARQKARRAAEKATQKPAPTALLQPQDEPSSPLPPPALQPLAPSPPALSKGGLLVLGVPGQLREDVFVTPRGRRKHKFKFTSPGGSCHFDEYVSPAGVQRQAGPDRAACYRRLAERRDAKWRASLYGCGICEPCLEFSREFRNFGKWKRWEEASAERPGPRASLSQVRAMVMKYRDRLMCECHLDSR